MKPISDFIAKKLKASFFLSEKTSKVLSAPAGNMAIKNAILDAKPTMICRLGFVEAAAAKNFLEMREYESLNPFAQIRARFGRFQKKWATKHLSELHLNAGVFPEGEAIANQFCEFYLHELGSADILGSFHSLNAEGFLHKMNCPEAIRVDATSLEPYYHLDPWSAALERKSVLVVHPFAKTILEQFDRRKTIFPGTNVLPEMKVKVIRSVQSMCGTIVEFDTWFDALQSMKEEMEQVDFDVCIVGAGAYGLPLCAHAKRMGKISIQMGGATQILFGIRGGRWDKYIPAISSLYNENWTRADESDRPLGYQKIEEGCYW